MPRLDSRGVRAPEELWHVDGAGQGTPAVDAHAAYFLSRTNDVVAIDRPPGAVLWRSRISSDRALAAGSRVTAAGAVVIAGGDALVAFERRSGRTRWRFDPDDSYGFGFYLGEVSTSVVFAGSATGDLWALRVATGTPVWRTRIGRLSTTVHRPVVSGNDLAVAFKDFEGTGLHGVALLDRATGATRWRTSVPHQGGVSASSALAGGPVLTEALVIVSTHDGRVVALRRTDGGVAWTWRDQQGGAPAYDFRSLARAGPVLVAGSLTGQVVALEVATGLERWRTNPLDASVGFALTATDRSVFVPYVSGTLVCVAAETGGERWRMGRSAEGFRWAPAVAGDDVYVAGAGAGFVARRTGPGPEGG